MDAEEARDEHRDRDGHEPRPFRELRPDHDRGDQAGRRRSDQVDRDAMTPTRLSGAQPVAHHPGLRERERGEDPDHVEVDQRVDAGVVDPEQRAGDGRQHDDPVREDEPVAEVDELPGEEAVARQQRGEAREPLVGRVRGEHQHRERQNLYGPVHEPERRRAREDAACNLCQHRRCSVVRRSRVHLNREPRHTDEHRDCDRAEDCKCGRGVAPVRPSKCVDAVGDRLDARQCGRPGCECAEDDEERQRAGSARGRMLHRGLRAAAGRALGQPDADQHEDRRHEGVGRQREQQPGLLHPAQVGNGDQQHADESQGQLVTAQHRNGRREREHARGDRHRDRQHVVREQCGCRDEAGNRAEVVLRHDVRAARALVDENRLAIREHDDCEQCRDRERDREHEMGRARRCRDEHDERRLGGVGNRRKRVGREDRQREPLRQQGLLELGRRHRPADDDPLQACASRFELSCLGHRAPSRATSMSRASRCTSVVPYSGPEPSCTSRSTSSTPRAVTGCES